MSNVRPPLIGAIVTPMITYVMYIAASSAAQGMPLDATGSKAGLKKIFYSLGETLGVAGSLAVGGGITLVFFIWLINAIITNKKG